MRLAAWNRRRSTKAPVPPFQPPPQLSVADSLRAALEEKPSTKRAHERMRWGLRAAAVAVALLIVALFVVTPAALSEQRRESRHQRAARIATEGDVRVRAARLFALDRARGAPVAVRWREARLWGDAADDSAAASPARLCESYAPTTTVAELAADVLAAARRTPKVWGFSHTVQAITVRDSFGEALDESQTLGGIATAATAAAWEQIVRADDVAAAARDAPALELRYSAAPSDGRWRELHYGSALNDGGAATNASADAERGGETRRSNGARARSHARPRRALRASIAVLTSLDSLTTTAAAAKRTWASRSNLARHGGAVDVRFFIAKHDVDEAAAAVNSAARNPEQIPVYHLDDVPPSALLFGVTQFLALLDPDDVSSAPYLLLVPDSAVVNLAALLRFADKLEDASVASKALCVVRRSSSCASVTCTARARRTG
jgi:hypothetical protein